MPKRLHNTYPKFSDSSSVTKNREIHCGFPPGLYVARKNLPDLLDASLILGWWYTTSNAGSSLPRYAALALYIARTGPGRMP